VSYTRICLVPYCTVNTPHLGYKTNPLKPFLLKTITNTQIHSVGRTLNFVAHKVATGCSRIRGESTEIYVTVKVSETYSCSLISVQCGI